ncbi:MAG: hypothetical protein JO338_05035 [Aquitalea sp.]|nr:hypothetical protein [Aquitalea sp.]
MGISNAVFLGSRCLPISLYSLPSPASITWQDDFRRFDAVMVYCAVSLFLLHTCLFVVPDLADPAFFLRTASQFPGPFSPFSNAATYSFF